MKNKLEDLAIGTLSESASHITGSFRALKILSYTIAGAVALTMLGGFAYAIYSLLN